MRWGKHSSGSGVCTAPPAPAMPAAPWTPALSSEAAPGPATKLPPGGREDGTHWAGRAEALPPSAHAPASPSPAPTTGQGPCLASVGAKGRKEGTQLLLGVSGPEACLVQPPPAAHEVAGLQAVTQQALQTGPDTTETHFTTTPGFTESPPGGAGGRGQGPRKYDTAGTRLHRHHTHNTPDTTQTHNTPNNTHTTRTHHTPNTTHTLHAHTTHQTQHTHYTHTPHAHYTHKHTKHNTHTHNTHPQHIHMYTHTTHTLHAHTTHPHNAHYTHTQHTPTPHYMHTQHTHTMHTTHTQHTSTTHPHYTHTQHTHTQHAHTTRTLHAYTTHTHT